MASTSAAPAASASSHQDRRVYVSVTLQCPVPREVAWKALVDKIRHPEKFVGSRDVKWTDAKTDDGRDCVDRTMTVGPPSDPSVMVERITWDEPSGLVVFAAHGDGEKSGAVTNRLEHRDGGLQLLTFTFDLTYADHVPQQKVDAARQRFEEISVAAVRGTIKAMQ